MSAANRESFSGNSAATERVAQAARRQPEPPAATDAGSPAVDEATRQLFAEVARILCERRQDLAGGARSLSGAPPVRRRLVWLIAELDSLISSQLDQLLHAPEFQQLESRWRGLHWLLQHVDESVHIKVKVLHVTWKELTIDARDLPEFDQGELWRLVYSEEFDMPGGEPFGVLLGDFEVEARSEDFRTLRMISSVAAAAFAPFVAAAAPSMLGLSTFAQLDRGVNLDRVFALPRFRQWNMVRDLDDSRFVALVMPRVLHREPYQGRHRVCAPFVYEEDVSGPDVSRYLWGTGVYALGQVLLRSFADTGWFADIRGVQPGVERGGIVTDLRRHAFSTDPHELIRKAATDIAITDSLEKDLCDRGFVVLCDCKDTEFGAFYALPSIQAVARYRTEQETANARLSAQLQCMLCVSRFAHYIKVLARSNIGSYQTPGEVERQLRDWVIDYVTGDATASSRVKANRPLRDAEIRVWESPETPGRYDSEIHLWPHYEIDGLTASIRITAENLVRPTG